MTRWLLLRHISTVRSSPMAYIEQGYHQHRFIQLTKAVPKVVLGFFAVALHLLQCSQCISLPLLLSIQQVPLICEGNYTFVTTAAHHHLLGLTVCQCMALGNHLLFDERLCLADLLASHRPDFHHTI